MDAEELRKRKLELLERVRELQVSLIIHNEGDDTERRLAASARMDAADGIARVGGELRELQKAEKRMADGTYGICERCEDAISVLRLIARPAAVLCIRCASREEKR